MYLNIGIDVAKDVHEACILNDKGEQIGKYIRVKNFKSSIENFRKHVESTASELELIPRIGMEATGIYWYTIYGSVAKNLNI
jgi:transposase